MIYQLCCQKNIVVAKKNLDITNDILLLIDEKWKKLILNDKKHFF